MCKKVMEKATKEVIRETCSKEREENRVKKSTTYFTTNKQASQCATTKNATTYFECNSFTTIVKEARQHMHEHM